MYEVFMSFCVYNPISYITSLAFHFTALHIITSYNNNYNKAFSYTNKFIITIINNNFVILCSEWNSNTKLIMISIDQIIQKCPFSNYVLYSSNIYVCNRIQPIFTHVIIPVLLSLTSFLHFTDSIIQTIFR
jgi:hypothetical protein